jgi:Cu2+-exporting ATPase
MMTLISLAISVAFVFSLAVTFGFPGSDLWWELATLVAISSPCYAEERRLLREHRNKLDAIVAHLLEHESRGEPEIYATAGRVGRSPRVLAGQVRRTFVDQRALP